MRLKFSVVTSATTSRVNLMALQISQKMICPDTPRSLHVAHCRGAVAVSLAEDSHGLLNSRSDKFGLARIEEEDVRSLWK
jgi:hypothetical protein